MQVSKQFKSVSEALESANKRMKAEGMEMSDDYNPADRSTYRNRRRRYDDQGFIDGDIFDPSDIAAGDYVDFGAYGNLFVLKAPLMVHYGLQAGELTAMIQTHLVSILDVVLQKE